MSRRRRGRAIDGVVLIDKPTGISSNFALQKVKRLYQAAKAGHTGALDPLATGMLPICLGEATKFSQFLLDADKRYEVTAKLGQRTSTSDSDGELIAERPVQLTRADIEQALPQFRGVIEQVPSMYSALKYEGQPLYKYARQGIEVPRKSRQIQVFSIEITHFEGDQLEMEIHCSKGTYIRTIVDDLGEILGCGAHVTRLHRTQVADYPLAKMLSIEALEAVLGAQGAEDRAALDALLMPVDSAVSKLPAVYLDTEQSAQIGQGQTVQTQPIGQETLVRLFAETEQRFMGMGSLSLSGYLVPKRLVVQKATVSE